MAALEQPDEIYQVGQHTTRVLLALGDLVIGWLLGRQAEVAGRAQDNADTLTDADRDFYAGKLAAARFFATTVLPRLESDRKVVESASNDLMDVPSASRSPETTEPADPRVPAGSGRLALSGARSRGP